MCKSKIFKSLVCGVLMALTIGTGVFAGTVERTALVRNVETYTDSYAGSVGKYTVTGIESYTTLKLQSTASMPTLFYGTIKVYNYAAGQYDLATTKSFTFNPGADGSIHTDRDMREAKYRYEHMAEGFYSTTSSVRLDYYKFTAQQYEG